METPNLERARQKRLALEHAGVTSHGTYNGRCACRHRQKTRPEVEVTSPLITGRLVFADEQAGTQQLMKPSDLAAPSRCISAIPSNQASSAPETLSTNDQPPLQLPSPTLNTDSTYKRTTFDSMPPGAHEYPFNATATALGMVAKEGAHAKRTAQALAWATLQSQAEKDARMRAEAAEAAVAEAAAEKTELVEKSRWEMARLREQLIHQTRSTAAAHERAMSDVCGGKLELVIPMTAPTPDV